MTRVVCFGLLSEDHPEVAKSNYSVKENRKARIYRHVIEVKTRLLEVY